MNTFSVKNFDKFQHYKDRSPPWIKLYNELLDDYDFGRLQDASKMHLIAIWLLASRSDNKLPFDPEWISRRINATDPVDLHALVESGFIVLNQPLQTVEQIASKPLAKCLPRERGRDRGETEAEKKDAAPKARVEIDPETDLFRRGKEVCGSDSGGLIAKLKRSQGDSVPKSRAVIETASTKQDPREYIGAVIRGRDQEAPYNPIV